MRWMQAASARLWRSSTPTERAACRAMRLLGTGWLAAVCWLLSACAFHKAPPSYVAQTEQSGAVVCSVHPATPCELSSVVWVRHPGQTGELVFGNDKPAAVATESSVFSMPFDGGVFLAGGRKSFYAMAPFSEAAKFEAMSVTPDGKQLVAMTAFDRYSADDSRLDRFNALIAWPAGAAQQAQLVSMGLRDGHPSSSAIRPRIARAIQAHFGAPSDYFKVEGLALLPGGRLLLGIREVGNTHTDFAYHVLLIEGRYRIEQDVFVLDAQSEFAVVRDFTPVSKIVGRNVGLSSLEYDPAQHQLYLLTTYESTAAPDIGAYLWVLPDEAGALGRTPHLVKNPDGTPFEFTHKAEGLAVLDGGRVFVVHDDDRNATVIRTTGPTPEQERIRKPNEAAFEILKISAPAETPHGGPAAH